MAQRRHPNAILQEPPMSLSNEAQSLTPDHSALGTRHSAPPYPVAWKINAETATLLGWGPAILMQLAHPLVAAGVSDHSIAVSQPDRRIQRLSQTIQAMLAITFGPDDARERAVRAINRIHDRVNGTLPEASGTYAAGTAYSAHDPKLLAWVHATLLEMLPRAYELYVGPLPAGDRDRYCAEATMMGPLLGIPDALLPRSHADLQRYLDKMLASGALAVGPTARELAQAIIAPTAPRWIMPLAPLIRLTTVGLLPPSIRALYGFRWTRRDERLLRIFARVGRLLIPRLPTLVHHWPAARSAQRILAN
jgi:uncharacterized protein (DUF2236 family)